MAMFLDEYIAEAVASAIENGPHEDGAYLCYIVPGFREFWDSQNLRPTLTGHIRDLTGKRVDVVQANQIRAMLVRRMYPLDDYADHAEAGRHLNELIREALKDHA